MSSLLQRRVFLDAPCSERFCRVLRATCGFYETSIKGLIVESGLPPNTPIANIGRLLSTAAACGVRRELVAPLSAWMVRVAGVHPDDIRAYVIEGKITNPQLLELAAAEAYRPTTTGRRKLHSRLVAIGNQEPMAWILTDVLPPELIPPRLRRRLTALQSQQKNTRQSRRAEQAFARWRFQDFHAEEMEDGNVSSNRRLGVIMTCTGLADYITGAGNLGLSDEDGDELIELILGCTQQDRIVMGIVDDRLEGKSNWARPHLERIDTYTVFGETASLRGFRHTSVKLMYESQSPHADAIIEHDARLIASARAESVHNLSDLGDFQDWLVDFTTRENWMRRGRCLEVNREADI